MLKRNFRALSGVAFLVLATSAFAGDCGGVDGSCSVADHVADEPVTRGELDKAVLAIIAAHPDVVIDALKSYQRQQAENHAAQIKKNIAEAQDQLLSDPLDLVIGNPKGDVTLVEFFDNQCPACKGTESEIEAVIKADPNVRIVLKEFVLHPTRPGADGQLDRSAWLGPGSLVAAKLALASKRQGDALYAAFHHELMLDPTPEHHLEMGHIMELAAKVGLDTSRLALDMAAPEIVGHIKATQDLADKIGVNSTPGIVVSGEVLRSHDHMAMLAAIKAARSQITASR